MATQATLINPQGQKVVVDSGSQKAQDYFGQGYKLMGADNKPVATLASTNPVNNQSTTTLSSDKTKDVLGIQNTTNQLGNTGITTNSSGAPTYANGSLVPQATTDITDPSYKPTEGNGISTGGYVGDFYYAPGARLPVDANNNPVTISDVSASDAKIQKGLEDQLAQSDAITAGIIQGIQADYQRLIRQQEEANKSQEAGVQNDLLMGGVTGQGSSAQYAPISSSGIVSAQINYGIQQIADLTSKENAAISTAKSAGLQQKFQIQDKLNQQIKDIRDEKVAAAKKLSETIAEQNNKLAEQKMQSTKDNAIANLYSQGITDTATILSKLKEQGITMTAKEINDTVKNIAPDGLDDLVKIMRDNSASAEVIKYVISSPNLGEAYERAGEFATIKQKPIEVSPGATLYDPKTGKAIYTAPTAKQIGNSTTTPQPSQNNKIPQPNDTQLNKLLTGYPTDFKSYIKSIVGQVTFKINQSSISNLYQQFNDMKSNDKVDALQLQNKINISDNPTNLYQEIINDPNVPKAIKLLIKKP